MSKKATPIHAHDDVLLKQARACGATVITNDQALGGAPDTLMTLNAELIEEMTAALRERMRAIDETWTELVDNADPELVQAITARVFSAVSNHLHQGGSFRHLIYDRLGFGTSAYVGLCQAGGLDIANFATAAQRLADIVRGGLDKPFVVFSDLRLELKKAIDDLDRRFL